MLIVVLAMRQEADFLLTGCEQAPRFGHWEVTYTSDANMTLSCWTGEVLCHMPMCHQHRLSYALLIGSAIHGQLSGNLTLRTD